MSVTWEYDRYESSAMAWNLPGNLRSLASKLMSGKCTELWVKAGVDNPGLRTVWEQWSDARCNVLAEYNIKPLAWFYCYPESGPIQWDTIARALDARSCSRIAINVEVEWQGYGYDFISAWWDGMIAKLRSRGHNMPVGFSGVPSWDKGFGSTGSRFISFDYTSFCEKADFSMPQAYWNFETDQIDWENPRNKTNKPVIPTLWAPGNGPGIDYWYTDDQLVDYAKNVINECEHFAGFSSWVAERPTYQFEGMRRVYELIPENLRDWDVTSSGNGGGTVAQKTHADIEREMSQRLTLPQLGGVEGRGMVTLDNGEFPFVEFQKYRAIALGDSVEGFFVNPDNIYSFQSLESGGKIRWL